MKKKLPTRARPKAETYFPALATYKLSTCILPAHDIIFNIPPSISSPAISVIIPVYNREEYIGECLDSLVAQTFQDFEVIVVDDCSTDNTFAIVESYREKFGERLKIDKTETNSGRPGVPRNIALKLAKGEYISFLDSDDMFIKTALEEMYTLAKKYSADLVYFERHYEGSDINSMNIRGRHAGGFVDKPTFESDDLHERVNAFLRNRFGVTVWIKFIKRDLLIDNKIFFPQTCPGEDDIWSYALIFYVKKLLRVPNAVYVHRIHNNSVTGIERTPRQSLNFWINPLILGLDNLEKLISQHEFFKANPQSRYLVLQKFVNAVLTNILKLNLTIESPDFYETIKQHFRKQLGEYNVLIPALCAALYNEKRQNQLLSKFKNFITARIDIIFLSKEGDFQIFSVSDDKANVNKPDWFQKDGTGYIINSYTGNVAFVAKAAIDGQVRLILRGMDIKDPKDKSKRIPYWIDYTKLIINGKTIFDTLTPAWHDKFYRHIIDAKADEEIKIEVEWLPHRSDT